LLYSEYKESKLEGVKGLLAGGGGEPARRGSGDGVGITDAEDVDDDLAKLSSDEAVAAADVGVVIVRPPFDDS
jgi:hypothetical protein